MVYMLQQGNIYGPVQSRRYGLSLGINLMPCRYKLCSFDCVYCHYGRTKQCTQTVSEATAELPPLQAVVRDLEFALRNAGDLDQITFSGNGEPTLYPWFSEMVDATVNLRDRHKPGARIALLSNGTGLVRPVVRRALSRIDLPVLKLDAGTKRTFRAINQPAGGVHFEDLVALLQSVDRLCLQSVFFDGEPANTSPVELAAYLQLVALIEPAEIHLYSIDRPVPEHGIRLLSPDRLHDIARQVKQKVRVPVKAFSPGQVFAA